MAAAMSGRCSRLMSAPPRTGERLADAHFWTSVRPAGYRLVFADESSSEVGCHATFTENGLIGIYGLRLKVGQDGRIADVEHLIARKGDASAFAVHKLAAPAPAFERIEPVSARPIAQRS